jgi:hypothetical protein
MERSRDVDDPSIVSIGESTESRTTHVESSDRVNFHHSAEAILTQFLGCSKEVPCTIVSFSGGNGHMLSPSQLLTMIFSSPRPARWQQVGKGEEAYIPSIEMHMVKRIGVAL